VSTTNDPFVHHPDLREKILEPGKSSFRKLDLAIMANAFTYRIGLSVTLFLLLMAGFYFGIIPPTGI